MKMQAAVMYGPGDIRIEEIEHPECPDGGFVLKIAAVGLCGSDIRNMTTDSREGKYPHIYGHEIVGVVETVSSSLAKYKMGDRLYIYPVAHCLRCENCRSGHSENCLNLDDYLEHPGGFAQYIAINAEQVAREAIYKIPANVAFPHATLGEPLSSVYACQDNIDVGFGDVVVIIGAGPIGCFHARLAKLRGASTVIMIEVNDKRLALSKKFGVDFAVNSDYENPIEKVMALTGNKGADKVISATPMTETQQQGIFMVRKGGIVVFFGGVKKGTLAQIDTNYVHYNNIWIYGHFGCSNIQCQKAYELVISPQFKAEEFITHILPLAEIKTGIRLMQQGDAIKVVLQPNGKLL